MIQNTEEWRPVVGFNNRYIVSRGGEIISLCHGRRKGTDVGRFLKPQRNRKGYMIVSLALEPRRFSRSSFIFHRLVALTFLGPHPDGKPEVNHIDGVKTNNAASNLEWASRTDNMRHAVATGLHRGSIRTAMLTNDKAA